MRGKRLDGVLRGPDLVVYVVVSIYLELLRGTIIFWMSMNDRVKVKGGKDDIRIEEILEYL